ncbi:MAG: acyl-CoA thioesterase [Planctomycetota bacterium]|nr:acyl-CoA thioesterase [Planctomycetaceae bacterium]MDQ3331964.1 acyl-CoA thioesterase [Planctomycetota bacterium]
MLRDHTIEIRVRYSETDAMGVLHHSNYLSYFEMGRTELLRASGGSYRDMEERGRFLVVTKIGVQYRASARYDDVLTLKTSLSKISFAKLEHSYEIRRDGQLLTTGETTLACVDREGKVQRMSELFPEFFANRS